jgi:hypothetical protein
MTKGKFGVYLWFYAALAFVLALLGQTLLCGVVLLFVIGAERDEWTIKQVMQALFIALAASIISVVLNLLGDIVSWIPVLGRIANKAFDIILRVVDILQIVAAAIGLFKVIGGKDANIPGVSALANRAFGVVVKKAPPQPQPQYYQPPQYQQPQYQAPQQPQQPVQPQDNAQQPQQ